MDRPHISLTIWQTSRWNNPGQLVTMHKQHRHSMHHFHGILTILVHRAPSVDQHHKLWKHWKKNAISDRESLLSNMKKMSQGWLIFTYFDKWIIDYFHLVIFSFFTQILMKSSTEYNNQWYFSEKTNKIYLLQQMYRSQKYFSTFWLTHYRSYDRRP